MTGILRGDLGFRGAVISDDIGMGTIADNFDFEAAVRQAILAGNDIRMCSNNMGDSQPELARPITQLKQPLAS